MLARDKILHLKGGVLVLLGVVVVALALFALGAHAFPVVLVAAGLAAGASVEATQHMDNLIVQASGRPPVHEVSAWDLIASAAPCWAAAAGLEVAYWMGWLTWPT